MKRYKSVDIFRGLSVILFLLFNFVYSFTGDHEVPFILKHNQGNILLPLDFIAAFFAFVLGVSLGLSYFKRAGGGEKGLVYLHYLKRYGLLILIGLVLDFFPDFTLKWGVLQSLGIAGIIATLILKLSNPIKLIVVGIVLVIYSFCLQNPSFLDLLSITHGGPVGAISYGTISIVGMVAASFLGSKNNWKILGLGIVLFVLSLLSSHMIPFNKLLVTPTYSLISAAVALIILYFLLVLFDIKKIKIRGQEPLILFGRNSLLAWILQYPLVFYPLAILSKFQIFEFLIGFGVSIFFLAIVYLIIWKLNEMKISVSF